MKTASRNSQNGRPDSLAFALASGEVGLGAALWRAVCFLATSVGGIVDCRSQGDCHCLPKPATACHDLPPCAMICHGLPLSSTLSTGSETCPSRYLWHRFRENVSAGHRVRAGQVGGSQPWRAGQFVKEAGAGRTWGLSPSATSWVRVTGRGPWWVARGGGSPARGLPSGGWTSRRQGITWIRSERGAAQGADLFKSENRSLHGDSALFTLPAD